MSERELTPLMWAALYALVDLRDNGGAWDYPAAPNVIAMRMGLDRDVRRRGNGASGRGGWAGYMAPAQRIISPLGALERRGLITPTRRPDDLSGVAYRLGAWD